MPDGWIDKRERMPTAKDADAQGCVLVWDRLNGVMVAGYRNAQQFDRPYVTHWRTPPEGPRIGEGVEAGALGGYEQAGACKARAAD